MNSDSHCTTTSCRDKKLDSARPRVWRFNLMSARSVGASLPWVDQDKKDKKQKKHDVIRRRVSGGKGGFREKKRKYFTVVVFPAAPSPLSHSREARYKHVLREHEIKLEIITSVAIMLRVPRFSHALSHPTSLFYLLFFLFSVFVLP